MSDNIECWRKVKGFENYLVSTMGRIYNKTNKRYLYGTLRSDGYMQVCLSKNGKRSLKLMHRLVAEAFILNPENLSMVDHHDTDRSNNKLSNLRWASNQDNQRNSKKQIGCSSKYKGVYWNKRANKWKSCICVNHVKMYLGYFTDELDAAKAYNKKAAEIFGLFALLNDIPNDKDTADSDTDVDIEDSEL
jgi:hypothetical protein